MTKAYGRIGLIGATSTVIAIAIAVALGDSLTELSVVSSRQGQLAADLRDMAGRLEKIEGALVRLKDRSGDRKSGWADAANPAEQAETLMKEAQQRLDAMEFQIAALQRPSIAPAGDETTPLLSTPNLSDLVASEEPQQPHGVSVAYQAERGQSEWGASAQESIQAQYGTNGFFANYGGSLATSCKQRTCRVEWALPELDTLSPEELPEVRGMAEIQLMALAAKNASQTGPMSVEWSGGENQPKLTVFLERIESSE